MIADIIIIACSKNESFIEMTQNCIDSLHKSESGHDFNAIIVETSDKLYNYSNATVYHFNRPKFSYHKSINFALQYCNNNIVGFFNNDLIFHPDWFTNLLPVIKKYDSVSPNCPRMPGQDQSVDLIAGYGVREQMYGWAIVVKKETIEAIVKLSEDVRFWVSETAYAQQLKEKGLTHALATKSYVEHLVSQTLSTKDKQEYRELTQKQQLNYKGISSAKPFFSIVMASFLGKYKGAATNRVQKFLRAVKSVIDQEYDNFELIIVSDGCDKTVELYNKHFKNTSNIKCISIPKQPYLSGIVRQVGIEVARGEFVIYLDTDDFYSKDHLKTIKKGLNGSDWVYYDDWFYKDSKAHHKPVKLEYGSSGTSSICHKRLMNVSWQGLDGYGHDFRLIEQLIKETDNYKKIGSGGYMICHTPTSGLDN